MPSPSPVERSLVGRIAANTRHARLDADGRRDATAAARQANEAKLDAQIPDHIQGPEREAALQRLRSAKMARLALASAKARRRNREANAALAVAEAEAV